MKIAHELVRLVDTSTKKDSNCTCEVCGKTFANVYLKRRHKKNIHGLMETTTEKTISDVKCEHCGKIFSALKNKREHIKLQHMLGTDNCSKPSAIKCTTCDCTFGTLQSYRKHLQSVHDVVTNCVHHQFDSKEGMFAFHVGKGQDEVCKIEAVRIRNTE